MRTRRRVHGFTLAELLVGLVVTSIVMTAVAAIVIGVQSSYQAEAEIKIISENGRTGLMYFERTLPLVGYGIDPRLAFDVTGLGTGDADNMNVSGQSFTPTQPALTGTVISDELRYRYRDPAFLRAGRIDDPSVPSLVTVDIPFGVRLPVRTLLLVACPGGFTTATVRVTVEAAPDDSSVAIEPAGLPFENADHGCLQNTAPNSPWVFLVHEEALRVVNLNGRPWLVKFKNFVDDPLDLSADNFDPIVPDVENFQVAFALNRRPGAPVTDDTVVGDDEVFFAQPANVLADEPSYDTAYQDDSRFLPHPANIRAVHIGFVVRNSRVESRLRGTPARRFFNMPELDLPLDGFARSPFHTIIATPNLASRSFFNPSLRAPGDERALNVWGG